MTAMTIEEAVKLPGAKIQAWSVSPAANGKISMALEVRGVPCAGTSDGAEYVWLEHDGGLTVYTTTAVVLEAKGDLLTASEGSWPRDALARIVAFALPDKIKRGIKAALKTGEEVDVLVEISAAAYSDPTYGVDELLVDAEWITYVAAALSRWAGLGGIETRGLA
jgi:hypothetical protein